MKVKYDVPIEVTKEKYHSLVKGFSGAIAHRTEGGKFWIKLLVPSQRKRLQKEFK